MGNRENERKRSQPISIQREAILRMDPAIVSTGLHQILGEPLVAKSANQTAEDEWKADIHTALANMANRLSATEERYPEQLEHLIAYMRFIGIDVSPTTILQADERAMAEYNQPAPLSLTRPIIEETDRVASLEQKFEDDIQTAETLLELDRLMKTLSELPSFEEYLRLINKGLLDEE